MRRLVAVVLVATLAVALAGCGGGGSSDANSAAPADNSAAPAPAAPAPAAGNGAAITDRSTQEPDTYAPIPNDPSITPTKVAEAIAAKQPLVLFFYDARQPTSSQQRGQIDAAMKPYRGLIDLQAFDVGKYTKADGAVITVDPAISNNPSATKAILFANQLAVNFTPYVIITDSNGYSVWRGRGPWDTKSLQRQIMRATQ